MTTTTSKFICQTIVSKKAKLPLAIYNGMRLWFPCCMKASGAASMTARMASKGCLVASGRMNRMILESIVGFGNDGASFKEASERPRGNHAHFRFACLS